MPIRRIYETPDPVLRQISKPVETFDDELKTLVADMFETMYAAPGIGLAAVQVGEPIRLLVIDLQESEDPDDPESRAIRDPRVFINPEILWHSDTEVPYTEGCLSVPEQYAEVMRPDRIRSRWQDSDGNVHEEEIDGLLAICLQHEMDHLNGVLFIDHLSRLKRDMVLKKLAKWRKEQQQKAAA
jgi:peptide deformylase